MDVTIEEAKKIAQAQEKLREYHVAQLRLQARDHEAAARALFEAARRMDTAGETL